MPDKKISQEEELEKLIRNKIGGMLPPDRDCWMLTKLAEDIISAGYVKKKDLYKLLTEHPEKPKDKQGIKYKQFPMENGSHYNPTDNQKIGYNQSNKDWLEFLKKVMEVEG
jgi:hypothetical protein